MDFKSTFNCNGKVNINDWQLRSSSLAIKELENISFPKRDNSFSDVQVKLFDCPVPGATAILNLKHFINCMEMTLKQFNRKEKYNYANQFTAKTNETDFYSLRKNVSEFVTYVRTYLNSIRWNSHSLKEISNEIEEDLEELLSTIRRFCSRLHTIPDSMFHYAASHLGNKCTQPEFHVYHMHLELRWLYVILIHARSTSWQNSSNDRCEELSETLELVINDLVYMSMKMFARIPLADLKVKTPYSCSCVRELWLMMQILIDDLASKIKTKTFWGYVNLILNDVLLKNRTEGKAAWHANVGNNLPDCKNPQLFSTWLIFHMTLLYGYNTDGVYLQAGSSRIRENYEQLEKILKAYVSKGGKDGERDEIDEELRVMIPLLRIITTEWWQPRIHIISFLWDCFHRRLDQPFLLQTSGPWCISLEKKTPADILKQTRERLENDLEQNKESSYGMFLRFLGTFLRKNQNDLKYWNQMKGRIFSKLTKGKVQTFSEAGMYNFISLFLTLAVTVDTESVCSVMLDLLPSISESINVDGKKCNLIWKGQLTVLLLYKEQKINFSGLSDTFTDVINLISCQMDENSRSMMISYVEVLNLILTSSEKLDQNEHILIGGWIDRYFLECPKIMLGNLTQVLVDVFQKCDRLSRTETNLGGVKLMLDALWSHVACRVRQLVFDPHLIGDYYQNLTKLALAFTIEALKDPGTAKKHKHSAASLFQHFTSINVKDVRLFRSYLVLILNTESAVRALKVDVKNFDLIIVQVWIRSCILSYTLEGTEHKYLTSYIQRLDDVKQIFQTPSEILKLRESREPIIDFIMALATKRNTLKTEQERLQFDSKYKTYFINIDKWILVPITEENIGSDLTFWIYRCVGTLIICCSPMMYNRNQQNNMLRLLINKVALPAENSPIGYVKNVAKRIFSMIILGIENLSVKSDMILQALIRDLFEQYLPLLITQSNANNFKVSDSLLKCFSEVKIDFCRLIFEKLADNFIVVPAENTTHKHCFLVMLLLKNLLKGGSAYPKHVTELIVSICSSNVIGCYMKVHSLHPHKLQTMDFLQDALANFHYRQNPVISETLHNVMLNIVQKYLSTSVQTSFEFLNSLAKIDLKLVKYFLPQIERSVADYERNRRQNAGALRYSLSQLQEKVDKLSLKNQDQVAQY
ncbi:protein MMS22-like [Belonocnema kinseyi]|uniref:protein MMS22-like n=1 Tax=Belonocnema kinseyi TaxID=2817044 RepID=UPI00143D745F|nr:protein MMS22-like [Belonocnema kinseyi]XP_033225231.1 protein MMS22-like [Belonocnema kinseyi]